MTLVMLVIVIAIAAICAALRWRRTGTTLYVISLTLFLAVGCGPLSIWLLDSLQSAYGVKSAIEWGKRNAIVLLGAGTEKITSTGFAEPGIFSYARIVESVELYNDCRKTDTVCKIFVSGGDPKHAGSSEAIVYRSALLKLGIDASDVLPELDSMNTWQNAQFTSVALRHYDADRVLLVSSAIHLPRAMLYFAHFGIAATPVRADYLHAELSSLPLSYNFTISDFALHEYVGIARYYVYSALGWNSMR